MRNALDNRSSGQIGFWERAFGGFVEARMQQADREINDFLQGYDDATLASYGYRRVGRKSGNSGAR